jgi:uncharacterized tellurite resistance protein B-like protein
VVIVGTKTVTTSLEKGEFNCPGCRSIEGFELKRVRDYFVLFFMPFIPMNVLDEFVQCQACQAPFNPNVLDYEPAKINRRFDAYFHSVIKRVMIHVLLADGVVAPSEIQTLRSVYQSITGQALEETGLVEEINRCKDRKGDLGGDLRNIRGYLNAYRKELIIKAAYMVAHADFEIQDDEYEIFVKLGIHLGMSVNQVRGTIVELIETLEDGEVPSSEPATMH